MQLLCDELICEQWEEIFVLNYFGIIGFFVCDRGISLTGLKSFGWKLNYLIGNFWIKSNQILVIVEFM